MRFIIYGFTTYYSGDEINEAEINRECSTNGKMRDAHRILAGKHKINRPFGRSRHSWNDNIKVNLKDKIYEDVSWIDVAEDRILW